MQAFPPENAILFLRFNRKKMARGSVREVLGKSYSNTSPLSTPFYIGIPDDLGEVLHFSCFPLFLQLFSKKQL